MLKFARLVVRQRKAVIVAYLVVFLLCLPGYLLTGVNYDLLSYMPGQLNSTKGERLLQEEFNVSGLGLIMARGKKMWEIRELIAALERIEGVDNVVWIGDYADVYVPAAFIELNIKERFISGDTVLLQVQFTENARSEKTAAAVTHINRIIGDDENILFGGEPAIIREMQVTIDREMVYYIIIAVVMIWVILTLSVSSYLDPLWFMIAVGLAVILNMGTNIFLGQISFLTASIAAVMQLGISLDYSIFLIHRFEEEQKKHASLEQAMEATVVNTAAAIASSALTTIGGFAALAIMQNGIGRDMGLVLAKGIIISLLVNLTFLPALILAGHKLSSRYRHRIMLPSFNRVAGWIVKARWPILAVFFLLPLPAYLAQSRVEYYYSNENYLPETARAVQATAEITREFGAAEVVYVITRDEGSAQERRLVAEITGIPGVDAVIALSEQVDPAIPEIFIPSEVLNQFRGEKYRYLMVLLNTYGNEQKAFAAVDRIREATGRVNSDFYVTGAPALTRDMASLADVDSRNVAIVSILCVALIIAVSFRSVSLPAILILTVELAIWVNLSFLYYLNQPVSALTPIMIGAIQLGATVDYAILFTLRYKENIALFEQRLEAVRQTIKDTGRSILTSALTLFSATFGISFIAGIKATREMTMLIGRGAAISMLVIIMGLPPLLLLLDKIIGYTTSGWPPAQRSLPGAAGNDVQAKL